MKKVLKIFIGILASLLFLFIVTISVALWFVFTPEKLSPLVREQSKNFITCDADLKSVEMTFFSTYPNFGIKIHDLKIINPMPGCINDTLIAIDELVGIIDFKAWWKNDDLILKEAILSVGTVNIFYDSLGHSNYDIFTTDTTSSLSSETESDPFNLKLENITFRNINFSYIDEAMPLTAIIEQFTGHLKGNLKDDILHSKISVDKAIVSLVYDHEPYLQADTIQIETTFDYWMNRLKLDIANATGTINALPIYANGIIEEDNVSANLLFNLKYNVSDAPIEKLLPMIPPSYQSYFDGITATGMLNIDGTINGIMNDTLMPMFYIALNVNKAEFTYVDVPLKAQSVNGEIEIITDTMTDSLTSVTIHHLEGKTIQSTFEIEGTIKQLFSDIYCKLNSKFNLALNEFKPMVPVDMKIDMKGNANGQVRSAFTLSQLEKSQFDKINIRGSLTLSDFDAVYDTLWVNSSRAKIDFALPNKKTQNTKSHFAKLSLETDQLKAGSKDNYLVYLGRTLLDIETSNVMDSTRIPDLFCSFQTDSLSASIDTINLALTHPKGKLHLEPNPVNVIEPHIELALQSANINAQTGSDLASMKSLNLIADITNHSNQKDIVLQWLAKGFIEMEDGHIETKLLASPLDIPSIKMNFDPENLNIKESELIIDKSDFQLVGELSNIHSYFKGDSILKGQFKFTSNHTNVDQLMALTSGIGYNEEQPEKAQVDTSYSGPYMVPKGIDITLSTNIKSATFETGSAKKIKGNVIVKDGILTLDDLKLTTPATRIQLTAIYRTPRKNHLYIGLDYHMLDIEIEELLKMVPDIDSLMPMLRSFKGKGEYHMAIETYLDSLYNMKKSTLRGAASITGNNLVLLDGETFSEIAKTLKFNKKTENKVDSLSAEFTIFKNEIDVYPFLIVMDKYRAIVAGRHNFDMSFDYHISLIHSPLPVKLGVDVKGTTDHLSYKLAPCKYAENYRPFARRTVENKQLELRNMIRQSLLQKVTPEKE